MTVIGGLEDYDLAHITAAQLREQVQSAWQARRAYPWCRDTPLDVFERFVANRRIYEDLPAWQPTFPRRITTLRPQRCRRGESLSFRGDGSGLRRPSPQRLSCRDPS
jgi:hypothetical protein